MKVLIFWDVYGRMGRKALASEIPKLKNIYQPDFIIANIENCTSWRWPISEHAKEIKNLWVDIMTSWDHIYDNKDKISKYLSQEHIKLIRPANFLPYSWNIWVWYTIVHKWEKKLLIIQLMWEAFMNHKVENPFLKLKNILDTIPRTDYDVCIVDFHRETTAEIYGLWRYFDGDISLVYGTHTHVQTSDAHIMDKWTGIISDVGMNGPYEGVIWAHPESVFPRFLSGIQKWKIEQQLTWKTVISALYAEFHIDTGICINMKPIHYNY